MKITREKALIFTILGVVLLLLAITCFDTFMGESFIKFPGQSPFRYKNNQVVPEGLQVFVGLIGVFLVIFGVFNLYKQPQNSSEIKNDLSFSKELSDPRMIAITKYIVSFVFLITMINRLFFTGYFMWSWFDFFIYKILDPLNLGSIFLIYFHTKTGLDLYKNKIIINPTFYKIGLTVNILSFIILISTMIVIYSLFGLLFMVIWGYLMYSDYRILTNYKKVDSIGQME